MPDSVKGSAQVEGHKGSAPAIVHTREVVALKLSKGVIGGVTTEEAKLVGKEGMSDKG